RLFLISPSCPSSPFSSPSTSSASSPSPPLSLPHPLSHSTHPSLLLFPSLSPLPFSPALSLALSLPPPFPLPLSPPRPQDTVNSHRGRHYFRNCAIFGHVDFIYGRHGAAVFDRCRIVPVPRPENNSPATIATHGGDTASKREGGFVFYRCWIARISQRVTAHLGRPWRSHARVVYMYSYLSDAVLPEGWAPWPGENYGPRAFLGEYQNTGPGAGTSGRVTWARPGLLNEAQVAPFMPEAFIRGSRWVRRTPVEIVYP
ncbi:unnamed protein product, partial [Closterium sp. NIES-64]